MAEGRMPEIGFVQETLLGKLGLIGVNRLKIVFGIREMKYRVNTTRVVCYALHLKYGRSLPTLRSIPGTGNLLVSVFRGGT